VDRRLGAAYQNLRFWLGGGGFLSRCFLEEAEGLLAPFTFYFLLIF
jgi:hypothetical protein